MTVDMGDEMEVSGRMPDARETAYDITRRVNSGGGYLNLLLRYGMENSGLDPRDRSLVTELAYGVQRHRNKLDHIIGAFSRRPLRKLDPEVLDILRLGAYQLSEMRIPQHAVVNETVRLAANRLGRKAASYVNAVMRRACVELQDLPWPSRDELPRYLETVYSHPAWLVECQLRLLGPQGAESLCIVENSVPGLTLRANIARLDASTLRREIESAGGEAMLSSHLEEALTNVRLPYEKLIGLMEKGLCVVQDESSMLACRAVAPVPGETVIDACAAPGGKAVHMAQLCGCDCRVIAVDRNERRLDALRKAVGRAGLPNVEVVKGDSTRLVDHVDEGADAVLVDAPCSGLGALQRNPETRWRRTPEDAARLSSIQSDLLEGCAGAVRPGGRMVYSVCTYTPEETVEVIENFLAARDDFRLDHLAGYLPASLQDVVSPLGYAQLWPHIHHMEGMFIARLAKA
jgi:16S rRNA (cytosine967-C5)-methyltransferase